jgi:hypothetical protein
VAITSKHPTLGTVALATMPIADPHPVIAARSAPTVTTAVTTAVMIGVMTELRPAARSTTTLRSTQLHARHIPTIRPEVSTLCSPLRRRAILVR